MWKRIVDALPDEVETRLDAFRERVAESDLGDRMASDESGGRSRVAEVRSGLQRVVPTFVRRRYALKFGIVLFVLGASVALIGSAATVQFSGEVKQDIDDDHAELAVQQAQQTATWNERNMQTVRMIARSDVVQERDTEHVRENIHRLMGELPGGAANVIYVERSSSRVVASTNTMAAGSTLAELNAPWTSELPQAGGRVHVSSAYVSQTANDATVVAYVAPVPNQPDRLVVYTVHLDSYGQFLRSPGNRGLALVVDGDGRVLFKETNSRLLEPYARGSVPIVEAVRGKPAGSADTTVLASPKQTLAEGVAPGTDRRTLVAAAPVPDTDWVLLIHSPVADAYGFADAITLGGITATFAGVLLITLVGAILGRNTAVAIDRLTVKTERMESGDLDVDFETERVDNIGRLYDGFASMRDALGEQIGEVQAARREAEAARQEAEATATHLEAKADEYSAVMEAVADGDLSRRMAGDDESEAMAEIAREFNAMIAALATTISDVNSFATEVAASSEEVTAASEEVQSASEQVTESVTEIVDGADRQDEQLREIAGELNGLSTTIEEIASSADQVAEVADRTAETGERGRDAAEAAIEEMSSVEREAEETVDSMERLQERIGRIEEVTEFISDVAEQTNILALNANIEAARAGEAGTGFAVVADEVKALAEETRQAAGEIEDLVEDVRAQTAETATEVERTSEEVSQSTATVEQAVDALAEIADYAAETNTGIQEISEATSEQASSTNQVVSTVEAVAAIAEQTSTEANNVAGAAEEQTSALSQMTDNAQDLSGRAVRLSETLDDFHTGEDAVAEPAVDATAEDD